MRSPDATREKARMKDSIIKRGNSYSAAVYVGRDEGGKKKYKWVTAKTKHEVKMKLTELRHQKDTGTFADPKGTLGEFMKGWLKDIATYDFSPRTVEGYKSIYRSGIGPAIGNVLLKDLKPDTLQKYYTLKLAAGLSANTVRHHHVLLHRALKDAVRGQLLIRNPANADLLTLPPIRHVDMHTFDEDGANMFLVAAMDTPYYPSFHTLLYTGIRRSELLALRWQDIDVIGAEISITRSMHQLYTREIVFRPTKTTKSTRRVALSPESCVVLRKHLENELALCANLGIKFTSDRLVFCKWDGHPLLPGTVSQAWRRLVRKTGFKGIRLHDARHTHASLLFKAHVPDKVIQERLGHARISTTLDLYVHPSEEMQKEAAETFGAMLASRISKGLAGSKKVNDGT